MDIYDMRRAVVQAVIDNEFDKSQAAFAAATGLSPSYVTRMLKPTTEASHKRIGEDLALRLEAIPALKLAAGALLDPKPIERRPKFDSFEITNSEWDHLSNLRDMSDEDKEFLRAQAVERSQRFRALRKQVLASVGIHGEADAQSVTNALGHVLKDGPKPPNESRRVKIRREAPKQLDSRRGKTTAAKATKVR